MGALAMYKLLKKINMLVRIKRVIWIRFNLNNSQLDEWIKILTFVRPYFKVKKNKMPMLRLGSSYGGWTILDSPRLKKSTVISAGLGQDASFDVEIASKFNCRVLIVDPTPVAVTHFEELMNRFKSDSILSSSFPYSETSKQSISSYDLSSLKSKSLNIIRVALWSKDGEIKFFAPPKEVYEKGERSCSAINYLNDYTQSGDFIYVPTKSLSTIFREYNLTDLELLKLDIEGAEIEVLNSMIENKIFPNQIAVEYDELNAPSLKARNRISSTHKKLIRAGYDLIHQEKNNFLYFLGKK
jgi:FkbM family methyltransferase